MGKQQLNGVKRETRVHDAALEGLEEFKEVCPLKDQNLLEARMM